MPVLLAKTGRDFGTRRLRSALLLLGIVIGVAGVVAIAYSARNLARAQSLAYVSASQADLFIGVRNFPPQLTNVMQEADNVLVAESRISDGIQWSNGGAYRDALIFGIHSFEDIAINRPTLVQGRWPGTGEVVLDESARRVQTVDIGDTIALRESVATPPVYARVSGFTRTPGVVDAAIADRATGYAPVADVARWRGEPGDNQLLFRLREPRRASETERSIVRILDKRGIPHGGVTIRNPERATGTKELAALLLLMSVFSIIGVVLSGFLVWNTVNAVMAEELRQIGVLRALGAAWWQVLGTYLLPALVVGTVGSVLGIALGVVGGGLLARFLGGLLGLSLPSFTLAAREVLLGVGVGLGVSIGASLIPAWQGTRVRALDLLRNYGIRSDYGVGVVARLLSQLRGIGALAAMGVRNTWRRRVRSLLTITVVGIAAAAFIGTQTLNASVIGTVNTLYDIYGADSWVSFNRPLPLGWASELRRDPETVAAEGWVRDDAYVQQSLTALWGIPADTTLYQYKLVAGRWYARGAPDEAVITSSLARARGLGAGDPLTIVVRKREQTYSIVGIVDDESTYLGSRATGKIFMTPENADRLRGRSLNADFFAVQFADRSPAGVDAGIKRVEERFRALEPDALAAYADRASTLNSIRILSVLLVSMVAVVALIGVVGLINTLVLNITERRRELGILRAIGAGGGALIRLLVTEGFVLGVCGYALGVAGGYVLARYLVAIAGEQLFRLVFTLTPQLLVLTGVLTLIVAMGASVAPGLLAARLRPIESVRYE